MSKEKTKKQSKKKGSLEVFKKITLVFENNVESVRFFMPILMKAIGKEKKNFDPSFKKFIKENTRSVKGKKNYIEVKVTEAERFEELVRRQERIIIAGELTPQSFFVSLVGTFDNFLKEIIREIFKQRKEFLTGTEKNISLSELFELNSLAEAKLYVLDREVDRILESRLNCLNWIETKLGLKFDFGEHYLPRLIEATERRNLFVHCGGLVDKKYIEICKKHEVKFKDPKKIGELVGLSPDYFFEISTILYILGMQIAYVVFRKLESSELQDLEIEFLNLTANLLNDDRYFVALELSRAAYKLGISSEELKLTFLINRALALKFLKKQEDANKILNTHDWSASDAKFRLAVAVIKNERQKAFRIMEEIGKNEEIQDGYRSWPLFKEFGKTKAFAQTYRKIFGVSYVVKDVNYSK